MEKDLRAKRHRAREAAGMAVDDAVFRAKLPRDVAEGSAARPGGGSFGKGEYRVERGARAAKARHHRPRGVS